jgi:hypothetical protein
LLPPPQAASTTEAAAAANKARLLHWGVLKMGFMRNLLEKSHETEGPSIDGDTLNGKNLHFKPRSVIDRVFVWFCTPSLVTTDFPLVSFRTASA